MDSNEPLRQRPGKRAGIEVLYAFADRSRLSWTTEYVGDVFDSSVPTGNLILPTYLRTDVAYTVQLHRWLRVAVAVDNLFDRRNESYVGFVGQERRFRLSATATF